MIILRFFFKVKIYENILQNNNNNNNNIYLKSNIHKSSIDYKYIHMYNKIMLYT